MKKSAPDSPFADAIPIGPIAQGDEAASKGEWPRAIAAWESALNGPHHAQAVARLQWFMIETGSHEPSPTFRKPVLLISAALAVLGTAIVLLAQTSTGTVANVLAIAAWTCYVATAFGAVVYAWLIGTASSSPDLDDAILRHAREHALGLRSSEPVAPDVRR